jgi:ABC-2 type transport system ATP-binding protein
LKADGLSILLTTHYIQEAEKLCDRVGIIQKGRLRRIGQTKDLIKELTKREIVLKMKQLPSEDPKHPGFVRRSGSDLIFQVPASMGAGDLLDSLGLELRQVADLQIREGSLEDALKRVLGDDGSQQVLKPEASAHV